jgi:hypothetical protein
MKNSICGGILVLAVALLIPQNLQAQGTTYLSNLDQASAGSLAWEAIHGWQHRLELEPMPAVIR